MSSEFLLIGVGILVTIAIFDIMVGVSNDAVNFLNSSFGSRVASRKTIMIIASLGILAGVTFSSGMMEVARKGIFHPQFFTMPELMTIFLAVMITDIILLDLFNTYGLPTSTTVSVVFELLGAAVAISVLKIVQAGDSLMTIVQYINSAKAITIIMGILLSVAVSFVCGAVVQFLTRLLFTFDYQQRIKRYGALWGGVAMSSITYFILVKGAKGASFMSSQNVAWIKSHTGLILFGIFIVSAIILQMLQMLKFNLLKPVVLVGTFALAMAFAANDLVNFIGVPLAGLQSYKLAMASGDPLGATMGALSAKVQSQTSFLLLAGAIMILTLWLSKKARTVTKTELSLSQQDEGSERFESVFISRAIVRLVLGVFETVRVVVPKGLRAAISRRLDPSAAMVVAEEGKRPSFDLLRASVNLMVASAVVSYATANKLPLSTTYVTFMVAMGSSFADRAWGRESAVYRVTGVLTVVGGWFLTAIIAFTFAALFATVMFYAKGFGVVLLVLLVAFLIVTNHRKHRAKAEEAEKEKVFNLKSVENPQETIETTFEHMSFLLKEIRASLDATLDAMFSQNIERLGVERKRLGKFQQWSNIISANVFKAMRLLDQKGLSVSHKYPQAVRRLQKLTDGHRDIVLRAYTHVSNHHKGLLPVQVEELEQVRQLLDEILLEVEGTFGRKQPANLQEIEAKDARLRALATELNARQVARIKDSSSKTRLSILFYAVVGNAMMLSKQNLELLDIFEQSFGVAEEKVGD
ncbi:sodium/phosphate symporter superfamily protein [Syntrophotalea carbinolica DSM 2380]|uniref:Phosphate transporter n=1 Tax=Syntrophotalea carbinolica (strain DSM 2380 / NBRC 103641 / GraBd1) TaxID=338963 RepID=Q3A886_SYNC1|nr:inorganic phosphate transporter [Syntrophotalea carbinolica]ABA87406.1 sodium/phosphate symporter superfamily protein [Syntrophotalea carbinolica DSM 2380]